MFALSKEFALQALKNSNVSLYINETSLVPHIFSSKLASDGKHYAGIDNSGNTLYFGYLIFKVGHGFSIKDVVGNTVLVDNGINSNGQVPLLFTRVLDDNGSTDLLNVPFQFVGFKINGQPIV